MLLSATMDPADAPNHGLRDHHLERLIVLSDGVFAIAITLLAIDLKPPANWDYTLDGLVRGMGGDFATYLFSFVSVAVYWLLHRRTFGYIVRSDFVLTVLNFILLGLVTLLPFLARLMQFSRKGTDSLALYLGAIAAIGLASAAQWGWAAFAGKLLRPGLPLPFRIYMFLNLLIVPPAMSAASALTAFSRQTWIYGFIGAAGVALVWLRRRFLGEIPR